MWRVNYTVNYTVKLYYTIITSLPPLILVPFQLFLGLQCGGREETVSRPLSTISDTESTLTVSVPGSSQGCSIIEASKLASSYSFAKSSFSLSVLSLITGQSTLAKYGVL